MAASLMDLLGHILARRRQESLAAVHGGEVSPYVVFPWLSEPPRPQDEQKAAKRVRRAMERTLRAPDLPEHFTPHSLRHVLLAAHLVKRVAGLRPAAGGSRLGRNDGQRVRVLVPSEGSGGDGWTGRRPSRSPTGNRTGPNR